MRCYGPKLVKDAPWPPRQQFNVGFPKRLMSSILGVVDQETDKPIVDPDPIGLNLAASNMFAVFNRYSVNSYQVSCPSLYLYACSMCVIYACLCCIFGVVSFGRTARPPAWLPTVGSSETSQCLGRT